ncbi:MAG: Rrf2 family transcriptional regulator [Candidatus Marinimicrobia bacterium]|jgi:Rrf2 family protein|nr:Rrf2 family transcriptional regulator [Candidatus Neomarinimicrobiota bacterium]MBT3675710.1 Rrf2 family transcriptional regulator [Candidatus Neomarinimicrobiota bacterium]MBT3763750.1 Rrf2 family transcriptional regulator [Candidatus Neomarinimicrobiota bacterium]MBT4067131.1 Rrf2 family transcriptional regulator [Candidatus Neomarinimicrobiota bacterium]MBT4271039.1 Rrf2 family transcriptional regulator [Candidatus Neomarinimicrobiota bacterium]
MLKITRKVEYALIALRHMQSENNDGLTSAKEIATQYGIPQQLLAKTLQQMAKDGIVEAVQGPAGGYRILANLDHISLKDFFENLEGPLGMMDCFFESDCIQLGTCNIRVPIQRINDNMRNMFSQMSVREVTQ